MHRGEPTTAPRRLVAALLIRHRCVLLARRTAQRKWYPGAWDLPGGGVKNGETDAQAIARELQEELGLMVRPPSGPPLARLYDDTPERATACLSVWRLTVWSGDVRNTAPWEHDELRWVTARELDDMRLAHPEYADLVRRELTPPPP